MVLKYHSGFLEASALPPKVKQEEVYMQDAFMSVLSTYAKVGTEALKSSSGFWDCDSDTVTTDTEMRERCQHLRPVNALLTEEKINIDVSRLKPRLSKCIAPIRDMSPHETCDIKRPSKVEDKSDVKLSSGRQRVDSSLKGTKMSIGYVGADSLKRVRPPSPNENWPGGNKPSKNCSNFNNYPQMTVPDVGEVNPSKSFGHCNEAYHPRNQGKLVCLDSTYATDKGKTLKKIKKDTSNNTSQIALAESYRKKHLEFVGNDLEAFKNPIKDNLVLPGFFCTTGKVENMPTSLVGRHAPRKKTEQHSDFEKLIESNTSVGSLATYNKSFSQRNINKTQRLDKDNSPVLSSCTRPPAYTYTWQGQPSGYTVKSNEQPVNSTFFNSTEQQITKPAQSYRAAELQVGSAGLSARPKYPSGVRDQPTNASGWREHPVDASGWREYPVDASGWRGQPTIASVGKQQPAIASVERQQPTNYSNWGKRHTDSTSSQTRKHQSTQPNTSVNWRDHCADSPNLPIPRDSVSINSSRQLKPPVRTRPWSPRQQEKPTDPDSMVDLKVFSSNGCMFYKLPVHLQALQEQLSILPILRDLLPHADGKFRHVKYSASAMTVFLRCLFTASYTLPSWEVALEVYALASIYKMYDLQDSCRSFFDNQRLSPVDVKKIELFAKSLWVQGALKSSKMFNKALEVAYCDMENPTPILTAQSCSVSCTEVVVPSEFCFQLVYDNNQGLAGTIKSNLTNIIVFKAESGVYCLTGVQLRFNIKSCQNVQVLNISYEASNNNDVRVFEEDCSRKLKPTIDLNFPQELLVKPGESVEINIFLEDIYFGMCHYLKEDTQKYVSAKGNFSVTLTSNKKAKQPLKFVEKIIYTLQK